MNLRTSAINTHKQVEALRLRFRLLHKIDDTDFEALITASYQSPKSIVEFIEDFEIAWKKSGLEFREYLDRLTTQPDPESVLRYQHLQQYEQMLQFVESRLAEYDNLLPSEADGITTFPGDDKVDILRQRLQALEAAEQRIAELEAGYRDIVNAIKENPLEVSEDLNDCIGDISRIAQRYVKWST